MRPAVRLALLVLGLGAFVYGFALWHGGWLGTPSNDSFSRFPYVSGQADAYPEGQVARVVGGAALAVVGLSAAAYGGWPRRSRDQLSRSPRPRDRRGVSRDRWTVWIVVAVGVAGLVAIVGQMYGCKLIRPHSDSDGTHDDPSGEPKRIRGGT